ncbi:MAG: DUF3592 domain-containing protein [bacterium]|nr:DUF3592 domain-containing protein [bacterium]
MTNNHISPFKRFLGARFFPAILILLGGASLWAGADNMANGWASQNWPSTPGIITLSEIGMNNSVPLDTGVRKKSDATFYAKVEYDFTVEGKNYSGYKVSFGEYADIKREHAERVLQPYTVGKTVPIFYNPKSHRQAVLEPGLHGYPWLFLIGAMIFLPMGPLMAKYFPKPSPRQTKQQD